MSIDPTTSYLQVYYYNRSKNTFEKKTSKNIEGTYGIADFNDSGDVILSGTTYKDKYSFVKLNITASLSNVESFFKIKSDIQNKLVSTDRIEKNKV